MGLELAVPPSRRLPQLTAVRLPAGADDAAIRRCLLQGFGIEVGAGLGPWRGQALRLGLMGHGARPQNVLLLLSALEAVLPRCGAKIAEGRGLRAASSVLAEPA